METWRQLNRYIYKIMIYAVKKASKYLLSSINFFLEMTLTLLIILIFNLCTCVEYEPMRHVAYGFYLCTDVRQTETDVYHWIVSENGQFETEATRTLYSLRDLDKKNSSSKWNNEILSILRYRYINKILLECIHSNLLDMEIFIQSHINPLQWCICIDRVEFDIPVHSIILNFYV